MGNNFRILCYGHKIIIPSNKSPDMKKNLPFSLLVLFTVFAVISCNTAYQSQLLQYKIYCINNNAQKQPGGTFENLMADKLMNEESCNMVICVSHPGDEHKAGNKVSNKILAKEIMDADVITCGHNHKFINNLIINKYKKADNIIVNQDDRAGIVLDRRDFEFTKFSGKKLGNSHTISVSQKTGG
jgi:riboflavin synthase